MADIKWSAFTAIGALATGDILVGLRAGANVKFNALTLPWSATLGGTGVANLAGSTITLGGALSTVGAFTAAFTMTGNTAVTFPTSGTLATTAGASGIVNSGTQNQLAWYAATGTTVSGLATANNGLLVTSATGVPSIGNTIGASIIVVGDIISNGGNNILARSPTFGQGGIALGGVDTVGNFNGALQNSAALTASRIWTFPDASGTVALVGGSLGAITATSLTFSTTSGIIGTTTNNDAAAGSVGEYLLGSLTVGTPVALTTGTATDIISISLTAGDWDVWGSVGFLGGATTLVQDFAGWTSQTSATTPTRDFTNTLSYGTTGVALFAQLGVKFNAPSVRMSLATTTTIYLSCFSEFTVSTCSAYGNIQARRAR